MRPKRSLLIACLFAVLAAVRPAVSGETCVVCEGPYATYRCQPQTEPGGDAPAPAVGQLLCIKELARRGGHQSCSAERATTATCEGEVVTVFPPQDTVLPEPPTVRADGRLRPPQPADHVPPYDPAEDTAEEPGTVEELAKETAKSSKKNLKKVGEAVSNTGKAVVNTAKKTGDKIGEAGSAVGGAAKKAWDCVVSLFSEC